MTLPIYIYKHPSKRKYVEIFQGMNDEHTYTDEQGVQYERVYLVPQATIKQSLDPNDTGKFLEATKQMKGNVGNITDLSEELSGKRAQQSDTGRDPVKDKYFDSWSKKRKGKIHPQDDRKKK